MASDEIENSKSSLTKIILKGLLVCVIIGGVAGFIVWAATRPDNIDVVQAQNDESLPSLIKVATLPAQQQEQDQQQDPSTTNNGAVVLEFTTSLEDPSVVYYYVNLVDVNYTVILQQIQGGEAPINNDETNNNNINDLDLILTKPPNPTIQMLGMNPIKIQNVAQQQFPYRLPETFVPGDYRGILFALQNNDNNDAMSQNALTSSFDLVVDPSMNNPSPTDAPSMAPSIPEPTMVPSVTPTRAASAVPSMRPTAIPSAWPSFAPTGPTATPSSAPSTFPTTSPKPSGTGLPTVSPSLRPSSRPSLSTQPSSKPSAVPTMIPSAPPSPNPTKSPTPMPVPPPSPPTVAVPPVLVSELESFSYNIAGTITIDYRAEFVGGQVQMVPFLRFEIPEAPRAPGPFLYLSKRPYSETVRGDLENDDVEILIDMSPEQGSYSVQGTFEQPLDEIMDTNDLFDYTNGSWIVWCRPFRVWLGGGPIASST